MAPRKFSLAAALWDFPQADDCAAPTQHVPDSWRILFEDDSTDSQVVVVVILHRRPPAWLWMVLHGMFSACPSGKQWTLRRAKSAKLTLDCTGPQADDPARQRQLQTLRQDLAVRGCLPTALQLQYEPTASSQEAVASCAEALGPSNSSVSSVTLTPSLPTHELLTAQAMTRAASALSNITMLTLGGCVERLPDPSHLLHLKHLHIPLLPYPDTGFDDNMCASLAPYLQQLTSLHLSERKDAPSISEEDEHLYVTRWTQIYWDKIFTTPTTTLTHFTTGADLDDEILGLLVEYAPALKHLSVRVLRLRDGDMGVKTWGVEKLSLTGVGTEEHIRARDHTEMQFDGGLLALELELLPRQQPGRVLTIATPQARERPYLSIPYIAYASGMPTSISERLSDWALGELDVVVVAGHSLLPKHDHAQAIRNTLPQLQDLKTPEAIIELLDWDCTEDTVRAITIEGAHLTDMSVRLSIDESLTGSLLTLLLQSGQGISRLVVRSLDLQSDQHANTPWPWQELIIKSSADMVQLLRLPDPAKATKKPIIKVPLNPEQEVEEERWRQWLSHVSLVLPA